MFFGYTILITILDDGIFQMLLICVLCLVMLLNLIKIILLIGMFQK